MKQVNPERFKKPRAEEIAFEAEPMVENPLSTVRSDARADQEEVLGRTDEWTGQDVYTVVVPGRRRKTRHPFDIYEDQLEALKKLQMATQDMEGVEAVPTLGEMAQEALDAYIREGARRAPNVRLIRK